MCAGPTPRREIDLSRSNSVINSCELSTPYPCARSIFLNPSCGHRGYWVVRNEVGVGGVSGGHILQTRGLLSKRS